MSAQLKRNTSQKRSARRSAKLHLNLFSFKRPSIIVVGDKIIKRRLQNIEKNFNVELVFTDSKKIENFVNSRTIAVVIDEKSVKVNESKYLEDILSRYQFLPIFYLSRKLRRSNFYMNLYSKGLQGVIDWPREASALHDLIIESLKPHPKASGESKGDKRLAKVIKSHIVLTGKFKSLRITVISGFVFFEGYVKSLFEKKLVGQEALKVLGVKRVITKNLKVRKLSKTTDKELERKIKMYVSHILGEDKRSIMVKVKSKMVTISGVSSSHGDIIAIEDFVMKQAGVQGIHRNVKYQPSVVSKNVKKAKALEEKIDFLFDGVKHTSIRIYGDFAEVSGTVNLIGTRKLIEQYLLQTLPVKKVINKIFVSKKRR